jgi:FlaA1/EpsC-like NDP-sugar epimerase
MNILELIRRSTPRWLIFAIDLGIIAVASVLAYLLRFNFSVPAAEIEAAPLAIGLIIGVRVMSFFIARTYAGLVRYTSTEDVVRIFLVLLSGSVLMGLINLGWHYALDKYPIPRSIIAIEFLASNLGMIAFRILVKLTYLELQNPSRDKRRVIILGAGDEGIITKRALDRDSNTSYKVVAFIEENPRRIGKKIEGVEIRSAGDLEALLVDKEIGSMIVAGRDISPELKEKAVEHCLAAGIKVWTVPPMSRWINGELSFNQLRSIRIEDLLDREVISLDEAAIRKDLTGKTVLITGAAGSIGSELARQIMRFAPGKVTLLDNAETPLHQLELEFKSRISTQPFDFLLADVRNNAQMRHIFEKIRPDVVYHAAAYKHVPLMESHPAEAVSTNIAGTLQLARLAREFGVKKFVLVSTDKAVNPSSVMGASKRIAEMAVQCLCQGSDTQFITTRFGNVLGSNGSVIPLFRRQIEEGGPITITHPEVTRYFMTIPEASMLVLEAAALGHGGEIFLFDMGDSVKILDLARKMIRLANLEIGRDIQIEFTGLRPGEKLYEELLHSSENSLPTHHPRIMIAKQRDNGSHSTENEIQELIAATESEDSMQLVRRMKRLVPEYISHHSAYTVLDADKA